MRFDKLLSFYIRSGRWDDRIGIWHDNLLYSSNLQQSTNTYQHLNIIVNVRTYNGQVWTKGNGELIWIAIRYMEWEKRWLNSYSKHEWCTVYVSKDYMRLAGVNEQRNASIIDTITKSYRLQSTHAKASDLILSIYLTMISRRMIQNMNLSRHSTKRWIMEYQTHLHPLRVFVNCACK